MRVVIAEDSALLRAGIERILTDAGHEVVAGVPDATNLLRLVNDTRPDLAIVDVRMPPTFTDEGIRAAALLRRQNPEIPPFGGRIDYLTYAGLYREVSLRVTARLWIENVKV